jgi:polysaccharide biosynthesis/export protein
MFLLVLAGCAHVQSSDPYVPIKTLNALPLEAGDVIRVKVWREADLSGDITVDNDGVAAIPRLGNVNVLDLSPERLRHRIIDDYSKSLVQPAIEIRFLRRLRVSGAVRTPGLYPVEDGLSVADAIAIAGGVSDDGSYERVQLVRGQTTTLIVDMRKLADEKIESGDEIFVPKRSWASRNSASIFQSVLTAIAIVAAGVVH